MSSRISPVAALALVISAAVTGCSLELGEIPFLCNRGSPRCPDGYECVDNHCVKEGTCPKSLPQCASGDAAITPDKGGDAGVITFDGKPADTPGKTDAPPVKQDQGQKCSPGVGSSCVDSKTLKYCGTSSSWKTDLCAKLCADGGFDYADGCQYDTTSKKYLCICGKFSGFGGLCTTKQKCQTALICATFGTSANGYCTKYCTNLQGVCPGTTPSGTLARCILQINTSSGLQYACGFDCTMAQCPTGMKCDYLAGYCKP